MRRSNMKFVVAIVFLIMILSPGTLLAHKVKIFAYADGDVIKGYAYYAGGDKIKGAEIEVYDQAGHKEDIVTSDAKGVFVYQRQKVASYRFIYKTHHGHGAEFILPAIDNAQGTMKNGAGPAPSTQKASLLLSENQTELAELVEKAVASQVNPLREQLVRYEERVRLHDILGGIGYIFGLAGLAAFFAKKKYKH